MGCLTGCQSWRYVLFCQILFLRHPYDSWYEWFSFHHGSCASMADIFHMFSVCLRILRPKPPEKTSFLNRTEHWMQPLKNHQYYPSSHTRGITKLAYFQYLCFISFSTSMIIKNKVPNDQIQIFCALQTNMISLQLETNCVDVTSNFLQKFSQSSRNKKTLETESKNTLLFSPWHQLVFGNHAVEQATPVQPVRNFKMPFWSTAVPVSLCWRGPA